MNAIQSIIDRTLTYDDNHILNLLAFSLNGDFEDMLSHANCKLHCDTNTFLEQWPKNLQINNFVRLHNGIVPHYLCLDAVLCNDRVQQYPQAKQISNLLHIPLILVDHFDSGTLNNISLSDVITGTKHKHINIAASNAIAKSWNCTDIIPYGIDITKYNDVKSSKNNRLIIESNFRKEDGHLLSALEKYNPIIIDGNGVFAPKITNEEKIQIMLENNLYLYINIVSKLPIPILQAMAAGCTVLTNASVPVNEIIIDGSTGFIFETIQHAATILDKLDSNLSLISIIGDNARATIIDKYNINTFVEKWNTVFTKLQNLTYQQL
jgi:hypothetical protein